LLFTIHVCDVICETEIRWGTVIDFYLYSFRCFPINFHHQGIFRSEAFTSAGQIMPWWLVRPASLLLVSELLATIGIEVSFTLATCYTGKLRRNLCNRFWSLGHKSIMTVIPTSIVSTVSKTTLYLVIGRLCATISWQCQTPLSVTVGGHPEHGVWVIENVCRLFVINCPRNGAVWQRLSHILLRGLWVRIGLCSTWNANEN